MNVLNLITRGDERAERSETVETLATYPLPVAKLQIPRANGFSLTTGISTLSCQVNGMDLDYSGPRKSVDSSAPTAGIPSQESKSRAQLR